MKQEQIKQSFQAAIKVLKMANKPMSVGEIWNCIKENNFFDFEENFGWTTKTPEASFRGDFSTNLKKENSFFEIVTTEPKVKIKLKSQNFNQMEKISSTKTEKKSNNKNLENFLKIKKELEKFVKERLPLKELAKDEANTKNTFIEPFFTRILNYDFSNPNCVCLEFDADARKKGDKVDYAILKNKEPFILIEAKHHKENLDNHHGQLDGYFRSVDSDDKFAILTNGIEYRFYADFEKPNKMDKKPFLVINFENLENLTNSDFILLEKFCYENFNYISMRENAKKLYILAELKNICLDEFKNLSDEIIEFFARKLDIKEISNDEIKEYLRKMFNEILIKA